MTTPRHPGSKVVNQQPHIARAFKALEAKVRQLQNQTRPETLTFVDADPARGVPAAAAAMADTHLTLVYRSGDQVFADVVAGTGAGSVMEVQLAVPVLGAVGAAVQTPAGGTVQAVRVVLKMPPSWESGAAHTVVVRARRVSGTDATTLRVVRAWQR